MADLEDFQYELVDATDAPVAFGLGLPIEVSSLDTGSAAWRTQDQPLAQDDGKQYGRDFLDTPTWAFEMYVNAEDSPDAPADAMAIEATLAAAWRGPKVRRTPGALAYLRYAHGGRTRRVYGRPRRWARTLDNKILMGTYGLVADFDCADHLHYDDVEDSVNLDLVATPAGGFVVPIVTPLTTLLMGGDREGQVTVGGDTETWPVITIEGPVSTPYVQVDPDTPGGWTIKLNTTIEDGQTVVVDTRPWARTVLRDGLASLAGAVDHGSSLRNMLLYPGEHQIVFGGVDVTGTSSATISWRSAWASL